MGARVTGTAEVMRALNKQIAAIEGRTRDGLLQAGLFVESEAVPITPHSGQMGGTLRNSAFTDATAPGEKPVAVRVGYTAEYAAYVHEMPESNKFTSPGTGPKFLQRAVSENVREILAIIQRNARVPGGA